ncbi:MAG TPA: Uma2 family endonuclease [Oscillatoriales cyanobacterium M59_W2019_021]|nr:Uma2 family endonuclease [Oscillatoriales cyanobacterium M4454_W2019_049]HIK50191.1 Uma2 family endonuclease [Oscillatoriales cyanobacterium M59_W2019_021]
MTLAETHPPIATTLQDSQENTWVNATWEEFVAISDDPASEKKTCYYYDRQMRIETMGVGPDHAADNGILHAAIVLYCTLNSIAFRGLINASYRKPGCKEAQPDASYYVAEKARSVPQGNTIVNLDLYPAPDLAIEVAATSLNDDLGIKRLLYEELGIREYWVVDVENARIFAFQIVDRGSQRIETSNVLPGLEIATLETALESRKKQDDSQIMATLMTQFSA